MSAGVARDRRRRAARPPGTIAAALLGMLSAAATLSAMDGDSRLRTVAYSADEVYRLRGYVGYQIDLEFEADEAFVGLGAGDVEALGFIAQANHLFIKPAAARVHTNLTVLTTRRSYHFDYSADADSPDPQRQDVIYALRFAYPHSSPAAGIPAVPSTAAALAAAPAARARNADYWYCGRPELQPLQAWDDGVHTHLRFNPRGELPAVFVRNDDGSESLLNFNVEQGELVVHRIARQFVVRRGRLSGCIVNKAFTGIGAQLDSGTLAPGIERATRESR